MRKLILTLVPLFILGLTACEVEQTEEGAMPDVDVRGEAGQLPEYDVVKTEEGKAPDVDVQVEGGNVPEYDVQTGDVDVEEKTVTVPTLDYESPEEQQAEEAARRE